MARYKVAVPSLNVRQSSVADFSEANIITTVNEGMILDVEEVPNVPNPALGKWFRDSHGQHYWGNGLQPLDGLDQAPTLAATAIQYPWWLKNGLFSIPDLWDKSNLSEVTIVLLDSGINEHVDFDFHKIKGYNYLDDSNNYKTDVKGHGTHLAGMMVARGKKSYGIAPDATLFVAKVCNDDGFPIVQAVKLALQDIYQKKYNLAGFIIVNMSFELIARDENEKLIKAEIRDLINKLLVDKNILCVCSSGSVDDSFDTFPAKMDACIAVGCLDKNLVRHEKSRVTPILDIMAPGDEIMSSYHTNKTVSFSGTSQSAAFISGVLGLVLLKKGRDIFSAEMIRKRLLSTAEPRSSTNEYGHGIVNPNKFFEQLT